MGVSKVIYGGQVKIDLTADTIVKEALLKGYTAHGPDGEPMEGECEYDVDSSDATAAAAEILVGKTAAVKGKMVTGAMKNNGAVAGNISTKNGKYTVPQGFHDGSGYAQIDPAEQEKITANNIREGVTILGVAGTMSGTEGANPQSKSVTPGTQAKTVLPDEGYNYLSEVTVAAIPYTETPNNSGGITVTIG